MPKQLTLTRIPKGRHFMYEVHENGQTIAKKTSSRAFVACMVVKSHKATYEIKYCFGRMELIGKGSSKSEYKQRQYYGIAILAKQSD